MRVRKGRGDGVSSSTRVRDGKNRAGGGGRETAEGRQGTYAPRGRNSLSHVENVKKVRGVAGVEESETRSMACRAGGRRGAHEGERRRWLRVRGSERPPVQPVSPPPLARTFHRGIPVAIPVLTIRL